MIPFFTSPWTEIYDKWAQQYGPVFGIYEKTKPALVITDAELVKEIMIKKFDLFSDNRELGGHKLTKLWLLARRGVEWRLSRAIISPSFTASKMKAMFPLMEQSFELLDEELAKLARANKPVYMKEMYEKLTSTVIARCAFATEINPFSNPESPVLKNLSKFMDFGLRPIVPFFLPNWLLDWIGYTMPQKQPLIYLSTLCQSVVQQRRANGSKGNYPDLLQLLMDAKIESSPVKESVPDHESHHSVEDQLKVKPEMCAESGVLNEDEIVANAILFFTAGFESVATTLNFATYFLAKYPEVQEKLYKEIKNTFGDNEINYETLTGITYLDAFVSETLRFLPPGTATEREANEDVVLSNGLKIEKGTFVRFPTYTIHHNPKYFPDPEEFRVERFFLENRDKIIPGSYIPFGIGPRNCIGMRFALMELKLVLAKLVLKYKFVLTEDILQKEPKFAMSGPLLVFKNKLMLKIGSRTNPQ